MNEIIKISFQKPFKILCSFNNGEQRILDLESLLDKSGKYSSKVFNDNVFKTAKIGSFGQIYWEGIAEMKDLDNKTIPCEYDICPDYAYMNSLPIEKS